MALVTGGSRGLGADLCRRLAVLGAHVVVNGRDSAAVQTIVDEIVRSGGSAAAGVADASDGHAVAHLRQSCEQRFGPVSLLALFAGGGGELEPFVDTSRARWDAIVNANLTTTFAVLHEFLPGMIARQDGAVVTMASSAARQPARSSAAYAAAKGAIVTLTRHLAIEAAPYHVRINCVAPSAIVTDRIAALPEHVRQNIAKSFPLGRLGDPADVSQAALYLLSSLSGWITGVTLDIAGGKVVG